MARPSVQVYADSYVMIEQICSPYKDGISKDGHISMQAYQLETTIQCAKHWMASFDIGNCLSELRPNAWGSICTRRRHIFRNKVASEHRNSRTRCPVPCLHAMFLARDRADIDLSIEPCREVGGIPDYQLLILGDMTANISVCGDVKHADHTHVQSRLAKLTVIKAPFSDLQIDQAS